MFKKMALAVIAISMGVSAGFADEFGVDLPSLAALKQGAQAVKALPQVPTGQSAVTDAPFTRLDLFETFSPDSELVKKLRVKAIRTTLDSDGTLHLIVTGLGDDAVTDEAGKLSDQQLDEFQRLWTAAGLTAGDKSEPQADVNLSYTSCSTASVKCQTGSIAFLTTAGYGDRIGENAAALVTKLTSAGNDLAQKKSTETKQTAQTQPAANPQDIVTARIPFNAGMTVRGQVKRQILQFCGAQGLQCDMQDYGGVLSSSYLLVATGPRYKIQAIIDWLQRGGE